MRRAPTAMLVGAATLLLAACTSAGGADAPTWEPSPPPAAQQPGDAASPIIPVPSTPGRRSGGSSQQPGAGGTAPSPSGSNAVDPLVVATHLTAPVGLAMLPDGTALVGERTTGRIVRVQPVAGRPVPTVRTLRGLDTAGDGGLLDLALSPTFREDGLVYAYVTTRTDNRVVDFTLNGPVTPVLTGIPRGSTGNTGRIVFGADGNLYVGTGDAGHPSLAADPHSLAGKVLRVDDIGDPAAGNPVKGSSVWTTGHRDVTGLCAVSTTASVLEAEAGAPGRPDELNLLAAGGYYGWPTATAAARGPTATLPAGYASPGGCAIQDGRVWVTSLDGHALLAASLKRAGSTLLAGPFTPVLTKKYGRLRTVVAADDGALWLTTSNRDGKGTPVAADERVIRYVASGGGANPPV